MNEDSEKVSDEKEDNFRRAIKYAFIGYLILILISLADYHYDFWIYSTRSHLLRALFVGPIILGVFYGLHRLFTGEITRKKKFLVGVALMVAFPLWLVFQNLLHIIYGLGSDTSAGIAIALAYR